MDEIEMKRQWICDMIVDLSDEQVNMMYMVMENKIVHSINPNTLLELVHASCSGNRGHLQVTSELVASEIAGSIDE